MNRVPNFATFALLACLVTVSASGQTGAREPNRDTQTITAQDEAPKDRDKSVKGHNSTAKKRTNEGAKTKPKTVPSQEEQDFDKVLQGIFG